MKKKFSSTLIFIFSSAFCFGQKDSGRVKCINVISINAGLSDPLSYSDSHGTFGTYAFAGSVINTSAEIPIIHNFFGATCMLSYLSNGFNFNSLSYGWQTSSQSNYICVTGMPGIFIKTPWQTVSVDFHLLGGVLYLKTPTITYSGTYNNYALAPGYGVDQAGTWTVNSVNGYSFVWDIGATINLFISQKIVFLLRADMLTSEHNGGFSPATEFTGTYNGVLVSGNANNYGFLENISFTDLSELNVTIGFGYKF